MKFNPERIWKFIQIPKNPNECWNWVGGINNSGYGKMRFNYKHCLAHRFVYEYLIGEIPKGLTLDHLCRDRACVNPDHLEPVTLSENLNRGEHSCGNKVKTNCKYGHDFNPENTRIRITKNGGSRICKECHKINERLRREKQKIKLVVRP